MVVIVRSLVNVGPVHCDGLLQRVRLNSLPRQREEIVIDGHNYRVESVIHYATLSGSPGGSPVLELTPTWSGRVDYAAV